MNHIPVIDPSLGPMPGLIISGMEPQPMRVRLIADWQPIDTAPVPAFDPERTWATFTCLLQNERGHVFEGHSRWVNVGKKQGHQIRWYGSHSRWEPTVKYWMPMPEPKP